METRTGHIVPVKTSQVVLLAPAAYDYRERADHTKVRSMAVWNPTGLLVGMSLSHDERRIRVKVQEGERKDHSEHPFKDAESFRVAYATAVEALAAFLELSDAIVSEALDLTEGLVEAYFDTDGKYAPAQVGDVFHYNGWPVGLQLTSSGQTQRDGTVVQYVRIRIGRSHVDNFTGLYFTEGNISMFEERMDAFLVKARKANCTPQVLNAVAASYEVIKNEVKLRFNDMARRPVAKKGVARECEEALA